MYKNLLANVLIRLKWRGCHVWRGSLQIPNILCVSSVQPWLSKPFYWLSYFKRWQGPINFDYFNCNCFRFFLQFYSKPSARYFSSGSRSFLVETPWLMSLMTVTIVLSLKVHWCSFHYVINLAILKLWHTVTCLASVWDFAGRACLLPLVTCMCLLIIQILVRKEVRIKLTLK